MKPTTLLWCAAVVAACANVGSPTPADNQRLAQAQSLLATDPNAALNITDELLKAAPEWREARLCAAEGARRLAQTSSGMQPQLLLQDAVRNVKVVLDAAAPGTEPDAWKLAADCHFDLGEFEAATAAARSAAEGYAARRTGDGRRLAADAILLAANASLRTFVAARNAEVADGEKDPRGVVKPGKEVTALAAEVVQQFASVRDAHPGEACTQTALVYQYLGQDGAATAEFERGIRATPDADAIHTAYIDWMVAVGQQEAMAGAYSGFIRENPSTPVLHWWQGRALYARADQLRALGNFQGAIAAYTKAQAAYGQYQAMVPANAANAAQWLALCELSIARTSVELGDFAGARAHLFAADAASPVAVAYDDGKPRLADSFGSHYTGVVFALNRALAESGADGVQKALVFNEAVLQRHPDRWGFVYNNAALPARDLGVQRAAEGKASEAMELWERSYRYYEKAVQLSPDDARIVNDCGLMLIYHLNRDFGRARELFERAIAVGQPQLDAMPADADRRERELLEEAIGDAWQNIAVLLRRHQGKPFAEYREYCEKAVRYYPYERRAAAALLRSEGKDDGDTPMAAAPQGGAAEALAKIAPQVQQKVDEGDFDAALSLLDGLAKECKDHAPYHARRGELTLLLAKQSITEKRKGTDLFFQDAVAALKKAVALDGEPIAPRQLLAQALYDSNDLEGAAGAASALLLHMQSKGGGKPDEIAAVHTLRANAAARAFAAKKGENKDDQELLTAARTSFRALDSQGKLDLPLLDLWSVTEQWAGAAAEAVNVYARALQKNPADQALPGRLVDTAATQKQMALCLEALGKLGSDATILWYTGKARYLLADEERQAGKTNEALQMLDLAAKDFTASMSANAGFRDSCEQWLAMCLGKKGNIAFRSNDLANAERWLLEAAKLRPDRIGEDLGLAESTKLGILYVADRYLKKQDLAKVEAIYRAASDAAHGDLDLLNNSGLFARDYGNQLENAGKREAAMGMYEQSYKAYRRAQQLDPSSVRLRNDCALIAIHYLDRDWELSKSLLDSAIADGQKTLAENPPADRDEKQNLDEAVGDCHENLALWHLKHSKDAAAAKEAAQQSMNHYPGARRPGARSHLKRAERELQGK